MSDTASPAPQSPSTEEAVQYIYQFAAELMGQNVPEREIERQLVGKGLDAESASIVVRNLRDVQTDAVRSAGKKNMIYGALWCVGGTLVTVITYASAASSPTGGSYVVAWGAIVFGAIQFFRGLSQSTGR